mgnify:CR=1 FL=1
MDHPAYMSARRKTLGKLVEVADAGDAAAANELGYRLAKTNPPDLAGAHVWYQQAAEAGNADAAYNLGWLLVNLMDPPDLVGARRWLQQAADGGNAYAA